MAQNLYGAPYWSPDTVGHYKKPEEGAYLTYFTSDLAYQTFSSDDNPVTTVIKNRIKSIEADQIIENFIQMAKIEEANQLGCSVNQIDQTLKQMNSFLRETEKWVNDWVTNILNNNLSKAQSVLDNWRAEGKTSLNVNLDLIIDRFESLTTKNSQTQLAPILNALAKDGSTSGLSGKIGEVTTAFNYILTNCTDDFLNTSLDKLVSDIGASLGGVAGYKPDFTYDYSDGRTITISVKNYKDLRNKNLAQVFDDNYFSNVTVQSTGTLANFLSNLHEKIDPALNFGNTNIELFYEYWLNLFYFRGYEKTSSAASTEIENFRKNLNRLLTLYGPIYLMTGTVNGVFSSKGKTLQDRLQNALKAKTTAMFFYITGQGMMAFSDILTILKQELWKAENMTSLEMHTQRTNMNITEVDVIQNGTYKESKVPRPRNLNGEIVTQKRYETYRGTGDKALSTNVTLKIQMSRFKGLLKI